MNFLSRRSLIGAALYAVVGCKRKTEAPASASTDAGRNGPASQPSVGEATLAVDGEPEVFPPVELLIRRDGSSLVVGLSTAEATGPAGENSMRFDMVFPDADDVAAIEGAEWRFGAPAEPVEDNLDEIGLRHRAVVLNPIEVTAVLHLAGEHKATVELAGKFNLFDPPDSAKPVRTVSVSGRFEALLKMDQ